MNTGQDAGRHKCAACSPYANIVDKTSERYVVCSNRHPSMESVQRRTRAGMLVQRIHGKAGARPYAAN